MEEGKGSSNIIVNGVSGDEKDRSRKWEGKASAKVKAPAEGVWHLLADFGSIHKWIPILESSKVVQGESGKVGCVRHSIGGPLSLLPGAQNGTFNYQKLVAFDPTERTLSYQFLDNNVGFGYFIGTFKVLSDRDAVEGCIIEWSFVSDPTESWTEQQIQEYISFEVEYMATTMAEALQAK